MNVASFLQHQNYAVTKKLKCLVGKVEEIKNISIVSNNEVHLSGNVFDIITCVYLIRQQFIMSGIGWDKMELELHPNCKYYAKLTVTYAPESNCNLLFNIKL